MCMCGGFTLRTAKTTQHCKGTTGVELVAQSCPTLLQPHGLQPTRLLCPWDSPSKNTGIGCHFLLQGIFQTQGLVGGFFTNSATWEALKYSY